MIRPRFILPLLGILFLFSCNKQAKYRKNEGLVYGTTYHITYRSPDNSDLLPGIEACMQQVDQSLSAFNPASVISRINQNRDTLADTHLKTVWEKAAEVSAATEGAFDITVAPLVNAWGFGFKHEARISPELIDSLLRFTGYEKLKMENGRLVKLHPETMLDASAIAKGYACDVVGKYLSDKGCLNYMVEIGGEVVARGKNPKGQIWHIGISRPTDDPFGQQELKAIVELKDKALATSGNYRNFYVKEGKKYAHTIDPHTGYPVQHNLLSTTVLADDCMTADAYATAFMVMGLKKTVQLVSDKQELEVYLVYSDEEGRYKTYTSAGFSSAVLEEFE